MQTHKPRPLERKAETGNWLEECQRQYKLGRLPGGGSMGALERWEVQPGELTRQAGPEALWEPGQALRTEPLRVWRAPRSPGLPASVPVACPQHLAHPLPARRGSWAGIPRSRSQDKGPMSAACLGCHPSRKVGTEVRRGPAPPGTCSEQAATACHRVPTSPGALSPEHVPWGCWEPSWGGPLALQDRWAGRAGPGMGVPPDAKAEGRQEAGPSAT